MDKETDRNSVIEEFIQLEYDALANRDYIKNTILLTIQWSAASVGVYLLIYMNKYLSGCIY
jgi:hypothetical protein